MDRESKITYIFVTAVNPLKESAVTWLKLLWDKILQKNVVIGLSTFDKLKLSCTRNWS